MIYREMNSSVETDLTYLLGVKTWKSSIQIHRKIRPRLKTKFIGAFSIFALTASLNGGVELPDPFAPPTRSWQQGAIYKNPLPKKPEPLILAETKEERAIAERIVELYKVFETNPTDETLKPYISDIYIQHSSMLPNGRQPLSELFGGSVEEWPVKIDVHRIIVKDNFAFAHVNFRNMDNDNPLDKGLAAVDIYLFDEDGRVTEHWDVIQAVPSHAPNPNGMFVQLHKGE
ncbi:MAG: hypothetical protein AAGB06_02925 [Verrucomicrobiota bacterium]